MNTEQQRRLDALEAATDEMTTAEYDYHWNGENAREPFSFAPFNNPDGEVNVIYDKNGKVEKRIIGGL